MKRLLVLLLICLLPMQVFAGLLTYRTAVETGSAAVSTTVALPGDQLLHGVNTVQNVDVVAVVVATLAAADADQSANPAGVAGVVKLVADDDQGDDDAGDFADSGDFFNHAGLGDEPLRHAVKVFALDATTLAPALRSDAASQPPFLPPAGRPPRV